MFDDGRMRWALVEGSEIWGGCAAAGRFLVEGPLGATSCPAFPTPGMSSEGIEAAAASFWAWFARVVEVIRRFVD